MKFSFEKVGRAAARLGHMTEIGRHGEKVIQTPTCFVYTKKGCIPHVTHEVLQMLTTDSLPLIFPLSNVSDSYEAVKRFSKGLGEFTGLNDNIIYSSVQDPAEANKSGYNDKFGVSLWSKSGRKQVDVEQFMEIQTAFTPDIYQALCDSDTSKETSSKRTVKAVERTLNYLDQCLKIHQKTERLANSAVFGTVEGGFNVALRQRSAKLTAERPVDGFIIDGLDCYGPASELLNFEEIRVILEETIKVLPNEKPIIMHSVWHPYNVILAVELGIDIFDASYPYLLCERGFASVFELNKKTLTTEHEKLQKDSNALLEINLKDEKFKMDFSPLVNDCSCHTCRRFTRAYINHLLNTSEMLAFVLLMIHNLHHYMRFFNILREALRDDWLPILKTGLRKS
ncbi:Queuine tRNA-ribosyltransferase subunit qtrtd1 [Chamberlinius hualienensis]